MGEPVTRGQFAAVLFAVLTVLAPVAGVVTFAAPVAAAEGDVMYRANAGGGFAANDGGPDWQPATDFLVAGGGSTSSHGQPSSIDSSVPSGTPDQIWETERYDPGDGDEMQYEFDVPQGQQVEVRLYFYDGYSGTESVGDRVFDVSVEDQTVEGFDPVEQYGDDTGGMQSFTVTSDGTIDVDFAHVTENPQINAIEVVSVESQPNELGGPSSVDMGSVVTGSNETETVTVTNLGGDGDPSIDITDVSVTGEDAGEFSAGSASQTTLAPGESADIPVTFSPSSVDPKSATLEVGHSGNDTPLTVDLSGEGVSAVDPEFSKSKLEGFSAGSLTAIDFGPDGRAYVSTQGGTVYALDVERTGENSYEVVNEVQIDAIKEIPNHDDFGNVESGEDNRQITGLTAGGTADEPVVYVSSSDPEIDVGQDDDDTDTNSGAISRLTISPGSDGTLEASEVDHDVMVLGLPRSEENHATNGLDLSTDGDTLYVAQGGHTNKGAPGEKFGHTPEYALSAAILEIDLAQIEADYEAKSLADYDSSYPDLEFYYGIPTIQNDDATDGDDLPFGGNDGANQAKLIEGGPVQIYSPGYRNPYDLVVAESGQIYAADHGPNGGWGGQPADANGDIVADAASVTNRPNENGSFSTNDQLVKVDEGEYGGHAAPIRANPTGADIYDKDWNVKFDITSSNSPVPSSTVNPGEADYIPPTSGSPDPGAPAGSANTMVDENGNPVLFGPTGGTTEYTASNFDGAMQGDLLQVELSGDIKRVELSADGSTVTNVETIATTGGPLGITAQDDDEQFGGTVWTANHGGGDITVFEPVDYGSDGGDGGGEQCTGADDSSLDEDGDGYDNADEIDAGTDPCSSASTPADFDDDDTSNVNDLDDDDDGLADTEDPFAVDPNNGVDTTLPVQHDLSELSLFGENGQGWTGVMTNGEDDYQDLYDPTKMTVGGAAEVLTVEEVPQGDAHADTNTQQYGFQFGVDTPDEPFTVETTVSSFPNDPEDYQAAGLFIGSGDQSNYTKLVVAADGGNGGIQFAKEVDGSFSTPTSPGIVSDSAVKGSETTLRMTVDPTTDPAPNNGVDEVAVTAEYEVNGTATEVGTGAVPASWFDTSDGVAPAVGVISTSNGADSTFSATWTDVSVEYVNPPENQPPSADAGADQTVDEDADVTLDASDSSDPDGDHLGYTWTQTAGPDVSLSVNDGEQTTFTAPDVDSETTLTFQVSVSDGADSATDTVNVTVQDTDAATGDMTVAEAVASVDDAGNDSQIELTEIQTAINWWQTDTEVPNTGGQTIDLQQIQQLINWWQTDAVIGDGGGDQATGSALVEITPDSGDIDQSTYGSGSYQVTNTGEKNITSVSFDLSSASLPDMVFDPQGTAGDPTGEGLNVASDGGTDIVTEPGTGEAFSQPHNGQNADDGYDVMTVEFGDFESGEQATFWADNDPTSIKGATVNSQEAGPVSGLELARSTVTVTYEDGTTQTTQVMGDGSVGGVTADVGANEAPAPSIGADNVSLDSSVLDGRHSGATVSEASQTIAVTGQPGETVTLVRVEGELALSNVPDADGDGEPGYDIEALEANNAVNVEYYTATLDSNGEATIPVTLTDSADDDDEAGFNYFVAAHGEASGDTGLASNVVVLKLADGTGGGDTGGDQPVFAVNAGGSEYTATDGTVYAADTNFEGGSTYSTSQAIGNTENDPLYQTERYGNFSYDASVPDGTYDVTLEFAEIYHGTSQDGTDVGNDGTEVGDRLFDVNAEGQQVLNDYDIYENVGSLNATEETVTVEVTDGELNLQFVTESDNAKVSAITVENASSDGDSNTAPSIDAVSDQTVTEGDTSQVNVSAADADGDSVTLSKTGGPDFVALTDDGDGTGTLDVAPQSGDAGTYTVEVTAADGNGGTATESFQLTVESNDSGSSSPQVLHRVNAGEDTTVSSTDAGPDWTGVADTSSKYLASVAASESGNYCGGDTITPDSTVPSSTPDGVWDCERYGNSTWEFSTDSGQEVEVRLYLGNSFPSASEPGDRQFNVSIEGQQVLTQYDPVADVGHANGTMKSFTVADDGDGTVTVSFEQGAAENPEVRAIEIVETEGSAE